MREIVNKGKVCKVIFYPEDCSKCPYFNKGRMVVICTYDKNEVKINHQDRAHPVATARSKLWLKCPFLKKKEK